ncbi:unnamed protein product [Penicillium pancosmium]
MGPDQHAQLDGFGRTFPFPIRVAALMVAGFWGWAIILQYLERTDIKIHDLIGYPSSTNPRHHTAAYRLAAIFTIPLAVWQIAFWIATHREFKLVEHFDFIPQSVFVILLIILIWPFNRAARSGRVRFLLTFKRVAFGGLAENAEAKFGDILLADALTSYARVLADLYVSFCMFFTDGWHSTNKPNRACGNEIVVPIILAVPSAIRLRQCLTEYFRARRAPSRRGVPSKANQHLANALKYATAFPVIWLAAKLRNYSPLTFHGYSEVSIMRLLFIASFVNSSYSFWWDVVKDWDLTLFSSERCDSSHPYGLRFNRCFHSDRLYHLVIFTDLALRFSWLWRILPGLSWITETECGLFILMFLEVARRWMWVFFRVEAEHFRNKFGPNYEEIRLGESNGKIDKD